MPVERYRNYKTYLLPLFHVLAERGPSRPKEVFTEVADRAGIRAEERLVRDAAGNQNPVYSNRIRWAKQGLVDAGLVLSSDDPNWVRGRWELSPEGKRVAERGLASVQLEGLIQEREVDGRAKRQEARQASRAIAHGARASDLGAAQSGPVSDFDGLDEEEARRRISTLVEQQNDAAFTTMLERIRTMNEYAFEHLVGKVLQEALGAVDMQVTGKSRDGGYDGILHFDALGLRTAVFEAKRYNAGNTVGRPMIDAFATAARRQRAEHAIFVTSSTFSQEARLAADDESVRLVDGDAFVGLMAEHGVGMREKWEPFVVYEIDPAWGAEWDE